MKTIKIILKQLWLWVICDKSYPTAHIPVIHWDWKWTKNGCEYQQLKTLFNYLKSKI